MSTITNPASLALAPQVPIPRDWRLADLQEKLGNIPAERIRLNPPPGYATDDDVLRIEAEEDVLCELDDGVLVEKPMGWYESILATLISTEIGNYLKKHDLGKVLGADGTLKFLPGKIRIPDVSYISWSRFPAGKLPRRPIPLLIPDLIVEVLSESNTPKEMELKLQLYFQTGVRLVWYVDPETRSATSHTGVSESVIVPPNGKLCGGDMLPEFELSLAWLFEEADRDGPR